VSGTRTITADSLGRGVRIPVSRIPPRQRELVNEQLQRLGYPVLDENWSRSVLPPDVLPSRSERIDDEAVEEIEPRIARIDQLLRERVGPLLKLPWLDDSDTARDAIGRRVDLVAYYGPAKRQARRWELDLVSRQIRDGDSTAAESTNADWLLTGDVATWDSVLAYGLNLAACIRSRDVRYVSSLTAGEEEDTEITTHVVNSRIAQIEYLFGASSDSNTGSDSAEPAEALA
jgi:hypothetical protein